MDPDLAEEIEAAFVSLTGSGEVEQAVLPQMREHKNGCIINVTSVAGRISHSPMALHAASKFAIEALTEALAQETNMFNIRVAIVEPGVTDTALARRIGDGTDPSLYPQVHRIAKLFKALLQAQPSAPSPSR